jgi:CRP-like cAMP-binding protein
MPRHGRTSREGIAITNRLLLSLSEGEFQSLRPLLNYQPFFHHAILHESGEELEFVHFPNSGLVSIVIAMRSGKTVEVAIVGREGSVGTAAIIGVKRSTDRAVVQVAGNGSRIHVDDLESALSTNPQLQAVLNRYTALQGVQSTQFAACNRLHGVEQRLARWLLVMCDRTDRISLQLTHDSLATMLGTDRPSVSLAANLLQRRGAIQYRRGEVSIINHQLLKEATCECYQVIHELSKLL